MTEPVFDNVEETLFVPMRGRIFCSKKYPQIFKDEKALEISARLPEKYMSFDRDSEYTLMASAIRSLNMDICVREFLNKHPDGLVINIGCGLETIFYRNDNGKCLFVELDLNEVCELRKQVFGQEERDILLNVSLLDHQWIERVKSISKGPYLIISSGVFQYFPKDDVVGFIRMIKDLGNVELVFDAVSEFGIKQSRKYMKQLGKEDALMYFYTDRAEELVKEIGGGCYLVKEEDFYARIKNKSQFKFMTAVSMAVSDIFHMVKVVQLGYMKH